jgi:bis(5'-nucleosidyl)-tetraphosphatase
MKEQDESFGVIPLRRVQNGWEVFLIQHRHGRYWGFPKGHAEANESSETAACRELKEETNLDVVRFLSSEPLLEQYQFNLEGRRIFKRVFYYIAEVEGEIVLQKKEISDGVWLPMAKAHDQVTHSEGKTILMQAEKIISKIQ